MFELGKKSEIFGADKLVPLKPEIYGRPSQMPYLPDGHRVVAGYDQGLGERIIVCESLEDMQKIYDQYAQGYALRLYWYVGRDDSFVAPIAPPAAPEPVTAANGLSQAMNFGLDVQERTQGGMPMKDALPAALLKYPGVIYANQTYSFPDGSEATAVSTKDGHAHNGFIISDEHRTT